MSKLIAWRKNDAAGFALACTDPDLEEVHYEFKVVAPSPGVVALVCQICHEAYDLKFIIRETEEYEKRHERSGSSAWPEQSR